MGLFVAANDNEPQAFWSGLEIDRLPSSGADAKSCGCRFFYTGRPCPNGHVAPRYSAGGRCVPCVQSEASATRKTERKIKSGAARAHLVRALASLGGETTYVPSRPCKHGHSLRWVGTNNCVSCEEMRKEGYREARREARLLKKYGIASSVYEAMSEEQQGKCAICTEVIEDRSLFHVDHCHSTGKVRGLLCSRCNQAIGLLRENPNIIRRAASYVERHQAREAA